MRKIRYELTAYVGGNPSFPQKLLIDRCAVLALRLAQIDQAILAGQPLNLHDNNHAIAWTNAFRRTIAELMNGKVEGSRDKSVDEVLANIHARLTPQTAEEEERVA